MVIVVLFLSIFAALISVLPMQIMGVAIDEIRAADTSRTVSSAPKVQSPAAGTDSPPKMPRSLPIAPIVERAADYVSRI
jgi:subfamily B ATP-binding cassette protein MsbA